MKKIMKIRKMAKRASLILCLCLLFCVLAACAAPAPETATPTATAPETVPPTTAAPGTEPPTKSVQETEPAAMDFPLEMNLVVSVGDGGNATVCLPTEFTLEPDENLAGTGWNLAAQNGEAFIWGAREDEALFAENGIAFPDSIEAYAEFVNGCNNFSEPVAQDEYGMYSTTYYINNGEGYTYLTLWEGEGAYWMVHFICPKDQQSVYEMLFPFWASLMLLK